MTTTTGNHVLLGRQTENRRVWNIGGQPIEAIVGRAGAVIDAIGFVLSSIHGEMFLTDSFQTPRCLPPPSLPGLLYVVFRRMF